MNIESLVTPALLLDRHRLERNIRRMAEKARRLGVVLRPHIKTHKCVEIAKIQRNHGATGITVSTVYEAMTFARAGFNDITYAFPLSPDKFQPVREIAEAASIKVLLDNPETVDRLSDFCVEEGISLEVMMKVDVGYHRCGVMYDTPEAVHLAERIHAAPGLRFVGILTHEGHVYDASTKTEIRKRVDEAQRAMVSLAHGLSKRNPALAPEIVSIGSTPGMSLVEEILEGVTEVRPGNYVFYDYEQVLLGSCALDDCALTVLASVVGVYDDRIVIDAGATALSVDPGPEHLNPQRAFGRIVRVNGERAEISGLTIIGLSQEHGKVRLEDNAEELNIGDRVEIVPNHSCLTANLFDVYHVVEGDKVVARWRINRGHYGSASVPNT
ncbi:MAG: alanine racemase [Candidatus Thorarchaeota archaeon]